MTAPRRHKRYRNSVPVYVGRHINKQFLRHADGSLQKLNLTLTVRPYLINGTGFMRCPGNKTFYLN